MVNYKSRQLSYGSAEKIVSSILQVLHAQNGIKDKRILNRKLNGALKNYFDDGHGVQNLTLCFDEKAHGYLENSLERIKTIMGRRLTVEVCEPSTPEV